MRRERRGRRKIKERKGFTKKEREKKKKRAFFFLPNFPTEYYLELLLFCLFVFEFFSFEIDWD